MIHDKDKSVKSKSAPCLKGGVLYFLLAALMLFVLAAVGVSELSLLKRLRRLPTMIFPKAI